MTQSSASSSRRQSRGPLILLLDFFSSVRIGILWMVLLFLYSSIGSAGAPIGYGMLKPPFLLSPDAWVSVRQLRPFEMTEMEWFHWWPFDLLILLTCISLTVTTIRRIPFKPVNYGVWMIHSGLIILALGSLLYFGTKVEGDAPVARRRIVLNLPGASPVAMIAKPGNREIVGNGASAYRVEVTSVDPNWEILTGEHAGQTAYSVMMRVESPTQTFVRQVLANFPQYTEDVVQTDDPAQPMARAKNVNPDGSPLVDTQLQAWLEYNPQNEFFVMDSSAIYVRRLGETDWRHRHIKHLPRYNDYVQQISDVWLSPGDELSPDPINIPVRTAKGGDAVGDEPMRVTGYLRYARMSDRHIPDEENRDPVVTVELSTSSGERETFELAAFDPSRNTVEGGQVQFRWFDREEDFEQALKVPTLDVTDPETGRTFTTTITAVASQNPEMPFQPVGDTGIEVRVRSWADNIPTNRDDGPALMSVAIVEYRIDGEEKVRWVGTDAAFTKDQLENGEFPGPDDQAFDPRVEMTLLEGAVPPPVQIAAGPGDEDLRLLVSLNGDVPTVQRVSIGEPLAINASVSMTVREYLPLSRRVSRPFIVPRDQRDRNALRFFSMIQVHVPGSLTKAPIWLPFNQYAWDSASESLFRFPYDPVRVAMEDGTTIELLFSRSKRSLPAPVALDDFRLATHIGGYTGQSTTIRDYISYVSFNDDDAPQGWTDLRPVSVNKPIEHGGYWYFQSQWDPPVQARAPGEFSSAGLNYTILGVGNRNGVVTQLVGCCISVIGMMFAFYVKPVIKRRDRERVYKDVIARKQAEREQATEEAAMAVSSGSTEEVSS
ncbi:MAG: hypothetical protein AAF432_14970 [Planctomycetota bacterium]